MVDNLFTSIWIASQKCVCNLIDVFLVMKIVKVKYLLKSFTFLLSVFYRCDFPVSKHYCGVDLF